MYVTIKLRPEAARALHAGDSTAAGVPGVRAVEKTCGVTLRPLHPGATHELLVPYFIAEIPEGGTAEQLIKRLLQCPAVEAAYVKPPDFMP